MSAIDAPTAPAPPTDSPSPSPAQSGDVTWDNSPIAAIYNPDGSLKENAGEAFKKQGREDLAGFATRNNQGFFDALNQGREARAFASKKQELAENAIVKPGENATPEELASFRSSLGAGATAEDYLKSLYPDDLPEGFVKDEGMEKIITEWAAKHAVTTPEALQELASNYTSHLSEVSKDMETRELEKGAKLATETRETLTRELGGPESFEKFSEAAKAFLTSEAAKQLGFDFKKDDDGKLNTENPLHAAMMSDPTFLRMLKSQVTLENPAQLPNGNPMPSNPGDLKERKNALLMANSSGWQSEADFKEYQAINSQLKALGQ